MAHRDSWPLIAAGFANGFIVGGVTSAYMAGLFIDSASKATMYTGLVGFAGVITTIIANGHVSRTMISRTAEIAEERQAAEAADRKKALGHAALFKIMDIFSSLSHMRSHLHKCITQIGEDSTEYWNVVIPTVNPSQKINFTTDEMAMIMALRDHSLFNIIINCDKIQNSWVDAMETYRRIRESLFEQLHPDDIYGDIGRSNLTREQYLRHYSKMTALNSIIQHLLDNADRDLKEAQFSLERLSSLLKENGIVSVELIPLDKSSPAVANR